LARACGALVEIARDSIVETPDPMRRLAFSDVEGCVVFGGGGEERIGDNRAKNAIGLDCGCAST
jgi:hypothetical protein